METVLPGGAWQPPRRSALRPTFPQSDIFCRRPTCRPLPGCPIWRKDARETPMKTHTRAVVIGGGVVGCSVLYHLTKLGWSDVMLIERSELTSGSTWHAAGGFHTLNGDTNMAALQGYTIRLYKELEAITGMSCGLHHVGGITLADTSERFDMLQRRARQAPLHGARHPHPVARRDQGLRRDRQHRRHHRRALRSARRPSRPLGHHAGLCQGGADGRAPRSCCTTACSKPIRAPTGRGRWSPSRAP